jgi:hypothetical protein
VMKHILPSATATLAWTEPSENRSILSYIYKWHCVPLGNWYWSRVIILLAG